MTTKDAAPSPAAFKVRPNAFLADTADDATMYAEFAASVPVVDREGELMLPLDINVTEWKRNPVWLWAHNQKELPIGAGYKADGTVACWPREDMLKLGCRFSQANPMGAVTYGLYKEGTLKMVSVGFKEEAKVRLSPDESKRYGYDGRATLLVRPELVECSCVPVGMNRDAMVLSVKGWDGLADRDGLASVISRGHLHGERLPASMARDLAPFAASPWRKSVTFTRADKIPKWTSDVFAHSLALKAAGDSPMSTVAKAPLSAGVIPGKETKATAETPAAEVSVTAKAADAAETKAAETATAPVATKEMDSTSDTAGATTVPMGVETLKGWMDHLTAGCKAMSEAAATSDLPEFRDFAKSICAKAAALVGESFEYGSGSEAFKDFADHFAESAAMAQEYAAEEPDAADAGTEEETALLDDVEGGEKDAETATADKEDEKDKEEGEKGADTSVVTTKVFEGWYRKAFGEMDVPAAVEAIVLAKFPGLAKLDELAAQMVEHHEAIGIMDGIVQDRILSAR